MWAELSAQKRFLYGAGLGAIIGMSCCVLLSAGLLHKLHFHLWIEVLAIAFFLGALLSCVPVLMLLNEYTRLVRSGQSIWKRLSALKWVEIQALTAACPAGIKIAGLSVGALALFQCLRLSHFAVTEPGIASADLIGILSGATFFYSLCVPFLLSAAYSPGSYAQQKRARLKP